MIDRIVLDRHGLLREMIAHYRNELEVERARLDSFKLKRTILRYCSEDLDAHGRAADARQLGPEIQAIEEHIQCSERHIARMEELVRESERKLRLREPRRVPAA